MPETFSSEPRKLSLFALENRMSYRHFPKGALARESDLELARGPSVVGTGGGVEAQGLGFVGLGVCIVESGGRQVFRTISGGFSASIAASLSSKSSKS